MQDSLFERLGGEPALMVAVHDFYAKVVDDPIVGHFFDALDVDKQATKQIAFLSRAMGGPGEYHGRNLREAHRGLEIGDREFDRIIELLAQTLHEMNVPEALIEEVQQRLAPTRDEVLNR